jgi:hypothetical protein
MRGNRDYNGQVPVWAGVKMVCVSSKEGVLQVPPVQALLHCLRALDVTAGLNDQSTGSFQAQRENGE